MELSVLNLWTVFINFILFEKSKARVIVHRQEGKWNKYDDDDGEENGNKKEEKNIQISKWQASEIAVWCRKRMGSLRIKICYKYDENDICINIRVQ
jgi:hypothetical protein